MGLIVMISIDFAKNVIAGKDDDMKKNLSLAIKRIIYCVAMFLVPTIVDATMGLLGDSYSISSCWNMSSSGSSNQESTYNNTLEKEKKSIFIDPSEYDVPTQSS